jgi:SAM-dependent methyltransferase
LPYYFKTKPENVLIVGSGTGNDTAAAVRSGAKNIDAVEIDPAILEFGKQLHQESPYQAPNVNAIADDARAFIRHTDKKYDLIVYGLVTSHVLLSANGGIRLDSYIYTTEAFREARSKLKSEGIISFSFFLLSKELGRKLFLMLKEAFDGQNPLVYQVGYDGGYTFLCGDNLKDYLPQFPIHFKNVTNEFSDANVYIDKSTDDWPFFYMPVRKYPISYVIMILLLFCVSMFFIRKYIAGFKKSFSAPCFFLGAGFMLLETKAITELALFYGSTWMVISVVIAGILVMAFLANLFTMKNKSLSPLMIYGLLFLALITGLVVTSLNLNYSLPWLARVGMAFLLTLPLFFSGLAFSAELKKNTPLTAALSSNLLGAMLGGFIEYNSMYFGYKALYFIALIIYALALFDSLRTKNN